MAAAVVSYAKLMQMARDYSVDKNTLFVAAAKTYSRQQQLIEKIRADIEATGLTVSKEYVKGRENLCINPLVQELPKHVDSANRTLQEMLEIISKLGTPPAPPDSLTEFLRTGGGIE